MASELLLPLFPLELVLLPEAALPLHIFEERYKLMIGEAVEQQSEFGVVMWKDGAIAHVGCTASVERVVKRYPDGRLDIATRGRRRFEILFLDEQKSYLRGAVHFFEDDPETEASKEAVGQLETLFEKVVPLLPSEPEGSTDGAWSPFRIAAALPLDLEFKQQLLRSHSEAERVDWLSQYLEKLAPRLELARRVERRARGNGKGRS
jgi:Lon protease-like protein